MSLARQGFILKRCQYSAYPPDQRGNMLSTPEFLDSIRTREYLNVENVLWIRKRILLANSVGCKDVLAN